MNDDPARESVRPRLGDHLLVREQRLVDLSLTIATGMPIWPAHQRPFLFVNQTHEQFKEAWGTRHGFEAHNLLISEHTGTHTDALFEIDPAGATIENMPLAYFYGPGLCVDLTHVRYPDYITVAALRDAIDRGGRAIAPGMHVLLYTGHLDRTFPTPAFTERYTGLDADAARWLAEQGVVNIGIDSTNIDHADDLEFPGHVICAEYGITNTEGLSNLQLLLNRSFTYFGLPLKIDGGTGSPIRAVAWITDDDGTG